MEGAHKGTVRAVRKGRDHQARAYPQILVTVHEACGDHLAGDAVFLHVVPELRKPREIELTADALIGKVDRHVARMHVQHDHGPDAAALQLGQVPANQIDELVKLAGALLRVLANTCSAILHSDLHLRRPVHLPDHDGRHAGPLQHPFVARHLRVRGIGAARLVDQRLAHQDLRVYQPLLHRPPRQSRVQRARPRHQLSLAGNHSVDDLLLVKLELGNGLKALLQVGLHARGILGLGQNLEQLVVGKEEEPRKVETLLFQIRVEALVNDLEIVKRLFQVVQQPVRAREDEHLGVLQTLCDGGLEDFVHGPELL